MLASFLRPHIPLCSLASGSGHVMACSQCGTSQCCGGCPFGLYHRLECSRPVSPQTPKLQAQDDDTCLCAWIEFLNLLNQIQAEPIIPNHPRYITRSPGFGKLPGKFQASLGSVYQDPVILPVRGKSTHTAGLRNSRSLLVGDGGRVGR